MDSYLRGRKQRVKISNSYSSREEIMFGVPQGSILGRLLLNIFICDMFLFITDSDIASYADDNTSYASVDNPQEVVKKLEKISVDLLTLLRLGGGLRPHPLVKFFK